jgi:hypothetical protein
MVFSSILQNDGPKPKKIWVKWGTKHTYNNMSRYIAKWINQKKSKQLIIWNGGSIYLVINLFYVNKESSGRRNKIQNFV